MHGPDFIILKLFSKATGRHFSSVEFQGDTDMATDGWIALTSVDQPEILITRVSQEEHQAADGELQCENRVRSSLGRSDLRAVWFKRAETPRRMFYRDIFDPNDEAELVSKMSVEEFERAGGKILRH